MPTLLSVNNYFYSRGGAETVFLEHGRMFESAGWRVVPCHAHRIGIAYRRTGMRSSCSSIGAQNCCAPKDNLFTEAEEMGACWTIGSRTLHAQNSITTFRVDSCMMKHRAFPVLTDDMR